MPYTFAVIISIGAIAANNTLLEVHNTRNDYFNQNLQTNGFECRAAVPHYQSDLLGKTLYGYDIENQNHLGTFLVVDVQEPKYGYSMSLNGIAIDSDCEQFVHRMAVFYLVNDYRLDSVNIER